MIYVLGEWGRSGEMRQKGLSGGEGLKAHSERGKKENEKPSVPTPEY